MTTKNLGAASKSKSQKKDIGFRNALRKIALFIGKTPLNDRGRNFQECIDVITLRGHRFAVLSEEQLIFLANNIEFRVEGESAKPRANIPFLPDSEDRPRFTPLADTADCLRAVSTGTKIDEQ